LAAPAGIKKFVRLLRINEFVVGAGRAQLYAKLTSTMGKVEGGREREGKEGWGRETLYAKFREHSILTRPPFELILIAQPRAVIAS